MTNLYLIVGGVCAISILAFVFGLAWKDERLEHFVAGIYLVLLSMLIAIFGILAEILNALEIAGN